MKRKSIIYTLALVLLTGGFAACEDMLDVSSSSVQYEDKHELNSAADSLYSVIGILSKLQTIADRTVLLGELRGDLVTENAYTEKDLRELINHNVSADNQYYDYSDYYAIINNCNYYLAKVDTNVIVSNQKVMLKEVAVVKAIRAWTYLQLAQIYHSVPFITEPILTLDDAEHWDEKSEYKDLAAMCDYFIQELLPYMDTELPSYGTIGGYNSKRFFFPIRLLLGDMYLWTQNYKEAVQCYADYLYKEKLSTSLNGFQPGAYSAATNDIVGLSTYYTSSENITSIRMASSKLYGTISNLENIFSPTDLNEGKRQVAPSRLWKELSEKQVFAYQRGDANSPVTYLTCGDLRAIGTYRTEWSDGTFNPSLGGSDEAWYYVDIDNPYKINGKFGGQSALYDKDVINIYRVGNVYLRMAEALNRLGSPEQAFAVLKYGVVEIRNSDTGFSIVSPGNESSSVGGIHSRGSGNSTFNERYEIDYSDFNFSVKPFVDDTLVVYEYQYQEDSVAVDSVPEIHIITAYDDTGMSDPDFGGEYYNGLYSIASSTISIGTGRGDDKNPDTVRYVIVPTAYLVDKVEQMIVDEMALETAFEGHRYYDLMRVAMRRGKPEFLAEKIAHRNGEEAPRDESLYQKLMNPDNWFIRKK